MTPIFTSFSYTSSGASSFEPSSPCFDSSPSSLSSSALESGISKMNSFNPSTQRKEPNPFKVGSEGAESMGHILGDEEPLSPLKTSIPYHFTDPEDVLDSSSSSSSNTWESGAKKVDSLNPTRKRKSDHDASLCLKALKGYQGETSPKKEHFRDDFEYGESSSSHSTPDLFSSDSSCFSSHLESSTTSIGSLPPVEHNATLTRSFSSESSFHSMPFSSRSQEDNGLQDISSREGVLEPARSLSESSSLVSPRLQEEAKKPITDERIKEICKSKKTGYKRIKELLPSARLHKEVNLGNDEDREQQSSIDVNIGESVSGLSHYLPKDELDHKIRNALEKFHKDGNRKGVKKAIAKEYGIPQAPFGAYINSLKECLQEEAKKPLSDERIKKICKHKNTSFVRIKDLLPNARLHKGVYLGLENNKERVSIDLDAEGSDAKEQQSTSVKTAKKKRTRKEKDEQYLKAFAQIHEQGKVDEQLEKIAKENGINQKWLKVTVKLIVQCLQEEAVSGKNISDRRLKDLCKKEIPSHRITKLLIEARKHKKIYLKSKFAKKLSNKKSIETAVHLAPDDKTSEGFNEAFKMLHKEGKGRIEEIAYKCKINRLEFTSHINALTQCLKEEALTEEKIQGIWTEEVCRSQVALNYPLMKTLLVEARLHKEVYLTNAVAAIAVPINPIVATTVS